MASPVVERPKPGQYELTHLRSLEAEAIHIIREVAAEFERPVLLFSGGKDSIVMLHLAIKAFAPGRLPFPVMHVDTGHNFDEVIATRDELVNRHGVRLVVASVAGDIDAGRVVDNGPSRNPLQTVTLLRAIRENKFDAAFGGARRDEEKARAKERVFSFRDEFGQWDPKAQRPELWNLYNGRHRKGEHIRVFPLSNWTEYDIWAYIGAEDIHTAAHLLLAPPAGVPPRRNAVGGPRIHAARRRRRGVRDRGPVPHRGRRRPYRLRGVDGRHRRGGHRRDRALAADRTWRHPRRRPDLRGRHGRPQAGGLLLMATLLRFATAGSVDDGKSTLIGRLLYDSKAVMEDQLAAVERTSRERGNDYTDLALVTDGLRAEREQGITIDVAYRYFATPRRKFIIADTPGHMQYTRNMVTGTSTAQLAILLVDARHGLLEQSRRHAFMASLLGSRTWCSRSTRWTSSTGTRSVSTTIRDEFHVSPPGWTSHDVTAIPMSALRGDNVVTKSDNTPGTRARAAEPPRGRLHRRRPQPRRRAVPGAVRDPAADPRARRPPRLRGHHRQRRAAARRRGRCSASRKDQPHHHDRRSDRPGRRRRSRRWRCPSASPTTSTSPAVT